MLLNKGNVGIAWATNHHNVLIRLQFATPYTLNFSRPRGD